jgi:hypothetical protein
VLGDALWDQDDRREAAHEKRTSKEIPLHQTFRHRGIATVPILAYTVLRIFHGA